jgi:hypothetical protein
MPGYQTSSDEMNILGKTRTFWRRDAESFSRVAKFPETVGPSNTIERHGTEKQLYGCVYSSDFC